MGLVFSLDNIFKPEFNALIFSLVAMGVVFAGLGTIAIYLALFPRLLVFLDAGRMKEKISRKKGLVNEAVLKKQIIEEDDQDLIIAIATAIHLEQSSTDDNVKITWNDHSFAQASAWASAGRVDSLRRRGSIR